MLEELDGLVRSLSAVNQRQVLIINDREVWAACGVRLERAMGLLDSDPANAARLLAEAAAIGQSLYGREANMDAFLRKARKAPLASLTGPELRATLENLPEPAGEPGCDVRQSPSSKSARVSMLATLPRPLREAELSQVEERLHRRGRHAHHGPQAAQPDDSCA